MNTPAAAASASAWVVAPTASRLPPGSVGYETPMSEPRTAVAVSVPDEPLRPDPSDPTVPDIPDPLPLPPDPPDEPVNPQA